MVPKEGGFLCAPSRREADDTIPLVMGVLYFIEIRFREDRLGREKIAFVHACPASLSVAIYLLLYLLNIYDVVDRIEGVDVVFGD